MLSFEKWNNNVCMSVCLVASVRVTACVAWITVIGSIHMCILPLRMISHRSDIKYAYSYTWYDVFHLVHVCECIFCSHQVSVKIIIHFSYQNLLVFLSFDWLEPRLHSVSVDSNTSLQINAPFLSYDFINRNSRAFS